MRSRKHDDPTGLPLCISLVEPGLVHDITAARTHCLGALCPVAATGTLSPTDKGYPNAGIGMRTPSGSIVWERTIAPTTPC